MGRSSLTRIQTTVSQTGYAGTGGSVGVSAYGAHGDGVSDDAAAIQAAIDACALTGGTVFFPAGTYVVGTTLQLPGNVHLRGTGPGGNVFSDTDAALPFRGTVLKLADAANQDLVRTQNFAALTGSAAGYSTAYNTPNRFGLYDLVLDGNKYANSSGWPLRIYGQSYWLQNVVVQNGASGGIYSEGPRTAGYDNEAQWLNFRVQDNAGVGVDFDGPHDTLMTNGFVARNIGFVGLRLGTDCGSTQISNVHVWEAHSYGISVASQDVSFSNCVAEGATLANVLLLANHVSWRGGSIYGSGGAGEVMLQLGDGVSPYTFQGVTFDTRWHNIGEGSGVARVMGLVTSTWGNVVRGPVNAGTNVRFLFGARTTTVGSHALPVATLNVVSSASFPASGNLYVGVPGVGVATLTYTAKTASSFTGVAGGAITLPAGSVIWEPYTTSPHDTWQLPNVDGAGENGVLQIGASPNTATTYVDDIYTFVAGPVLGDGADVVLGSAAGSRIGTAAGQKLGFYGAPPVAQPTVTGSRGGNAALASLLARLAALGLVVDSSS